MMFAANDGHAVLLPEPRRMSLLATIERLRGVIGRETAMLRSRDPIELNAFNLQKRQGLLELTRQLRGLAGTVPDAELCNRLGDLRLDLEKNGAALQMHLDAVREIAAIVSRSIQEAESDGTYSMGCGARKRMP